MTRAVLVMAAVCLAFAAGAAAQSGWHVFATGQDSGSYGAYASANASVTRPHGLAVRVSKTADVTWNLLCDGETNLSANQLMQISVGNAGTCRFYASASTSDAGIVRVQLLKR